MYFAGIDLGTTYIKDHKGNIFPSGISENIYSSSNIMTVDGKRYSMELSNQKAEFDININKGLNKNTRLNFLYALYKLANQDETIFQNCIVGLPCSQWKSEITVEQFKKYLNVYEPITIEVNQEEKTIQIDNLDVVPEGSTAFYSLEMDTQRFNGRKVLLIDWGGLTLNSILFENDEFVDCHTDEFGILKVYKDMAEAITSSTGENVQYTDMFAILQSGFIVNGKEVEIEQIIKPIAIEHCSNIYKNLKLKWSVSSIPYVCMIGAGSINMTRYLKNYIPHAELQPNPQLLAAIGMGELAGVKI